MSQNWAPERADSATLHPGTEVSFRRIARGSWDCEVADHLNRSARFVKSSALHYSLFPLDR
jgi:hypothetical protein